MKDLEETVKKAETEVEKEISAASDETQIQVVNKNEPPKDLNV